MCLYAFTGLGPQTHSARTDSRCELRCNRPTGGGGTVGRCVGFRIGGDNVACEALVWLLATAQEGVEVMLMPVESTAVQPGMFSYDVQLTTAWAVAWLSSFAL